MPQSVFDKSLRYNIDSQEYKFKSDLITQEVIHFQLKQFIGTFIVDLLNLKPDRTTNRLI